MKQYSDLLKRILAEGHQVPDRTGVGTTELFAERIQFDLEDGFPLLSGKETNFSIVEKELAWMLSGSTNVNDFDSTIWDSWGAQYTVPREIVAVEPIEKEYEPYNFDLLGASIAGYSSSVSQTQINKLASTWSRAMRRCYDIEDKDYATYGGKGTSVCKRWHQVSNFIEDVQNLPHWAYKKANWAEFHLDKDYHSSNQYGPETCIWLRQDENAVYKDMVELVQVTDSCGESQVFLSATEAGRAYGCTETTIKSYMQKGVPWKLSYRKQRVRGHTFDYYSPKTPLRYALIPEGDLGKIYGHNFRHLESGDQIAELVAGLKADPHSRRHIVSSWIPESNKTAALAACHSLFQVNIANGRINLHMYQRSCDMFLGAAYNIAFYALLLELLAFETANRAGTLTISFGSVHIYNNHMPQVEEYLARGRHELPTLQVHSSDVCAASFDVSLGHYACGDHIAAKVAV